MVKLNNFDDETERTPLLAEVRASNLAEVDNVMSINDSVDNLSSEASTASTGLISSVKKKRQSSFTTVITLWSTMMGTSILTMPYAIEQAGLAMGIVCMIVLMGLCLYTAYRVIQLPSLVGVEMEDADYANLCGDVLNWAGKWTAFAVSLVALLGAVIIYWILMSGFLFNIVSFIYYQSTNSSWAVIGNASHADVFCPEPIPSFINHSSDSTNLLHKMPAHPIFEKVWKESTAPIFLILLVVWVVNFKSSVVFAKLTKFGAISPATIIVFLAVKSVNWGGVNIDTHDKHAWNYVPQFNSNFPALTGTLTLAFFVHNCVIPVMQTQKQPKNNARDLTLAYVFVCITYLIVGVVFYVCFPLNKLCLEDNFLNNFHDNDIFTMIVRLVLLLQMCTVLPLIMYVIRNQILTQIIPNGPVEYKHIVPINLLLIALGVMFAIFYPHISFLIRYTGAFCGFIYSFTLPCVTYLVVLKRRGRITTSNIIAHGFLTALGALNFIAQFFVTQRF